MVIRSRSENVRAGRTAAIAGATLAALLGGTVSAQPLPAVGPQVRIDPGGGVRAANETTVSMTGANPLELVAGWNDWRRSPSTPEELINSGFALSLDGGATWTDFLVRPPAPNQSDVEGDPMTAADPRTGTLWVGGISFTAGQQSGIYVARKDPGSPTFEPSVMARTANGTDKPWMVAGPRPGMPDTTRLYITFNQGVIWSDDMGDTWTSPNSLGGGLGFLPRVGPNGELYVAYWDGNFNMNLKRSLDGGASFTTHLIAERLDTWGSQSGSRFPGSFRVPPLAYIAVDQASGRLYSVYFDTTSFSGGNSNVDVYFTISDDQGSTWTTPVPLPFDDVNLGDQFFCWLEVDENGRLHMVYFDSQNTVQDDDDVNGMLDAYYAYSVNAGDTWAQFRLTASSWNSNDDGLDRGQQFIGDYLGLAVANDRAYPVYIDTGAGDPDVFTNIVEVPIPGDTNGDGLVDFEDLLDVLSMWGPCPGCPADLNGDGEVGLDDLLEVLSEWTG
jgi:hypothetical protein